MTFMSETFELGDSDSAEAESTDYDDDDDDAEEAGDVLLHAQKPLGGFGFGRLLCSVPLCSALLCYG